MRLIYIALSLILVLSACSTTMEKDQLFLLTNLSFKTHPSDSVFQIDSNALAQYDSLKWNYQFQIPAYKYIQGEDYHLFIGLPFDASLERLIKSQSLENDSTLAHLQSDQSSYYYFSHQRENPFVREYLFQVEQNLVHLLAVTSSSAVADSTLSFEQLKKRIIIKQ